MPTYNEIAAHFHSQPHLQVKVGKIDGDAERALATRFNVHSYPSFYVIDGYSVYSFEDRARSKHNLIQYVQKKGYKTDYGDGLNTAPLPFYASPLGPVGLIQGTLISTGYGLADIFVWLQDSFHLSPIFAGMILFGSAFVGCFIMIVILAIAMTPKEKQD
uniref:Thioredoxin domain-containing protein n=2 Tax=Entomoneis paludosa TaxID=265537 RepID=A0A7S2YFM2_9STRA|mmetsp:Transcript_31148/g.64981  ORF Transcript_31148/g.64981 Transcript_31148/m.64981 type:complete len:160 (+) Transcript_31148:138-617(+)